MKRLLLCLTLLCACISVPRTASAISPGWVVFTVHADPLDPLGGTSTGWLEIAKIDSNGRPRQIFGGVDFWWQAHHWTAENTYAFDWIDTAPPTYQETLLDWGLDGGTGEDYQWGNFLSEDFDFSLYKSQFFAYVNPTASHFAANGQSYFSTFSWYFTTEQPAPAQPPGIPEPSSLALLTLGVGAGIASRRKI